MIYFALLLIAFSLLLFMANAKYFNESSETKVFQGNYKFKDENDDWFVAFIPDSLKLYVETNLCYTKKTAFEVYREFFLAFVVFCVILIVFFFTRSINYLFLALFPLLVVCLDFVSSVETGKKSFIKSLEHLVSCLEILTVKAEMALSNALKIVCDDLPQQYYVTRKELNSILLNSEKFGMLQTLNEYKANTIEEKEFISILISIYQGTNKKALKKNVVDFIDRQKVIAEEKRKLLVDNMQLIMMVPGTIMLLIVMYPLIDMVLFSMKGAFNF